MWFSAVTSVNDRDLYYATRATEGDPFGAPVRAASVNTNANDADPALTADGLELFFVSEVLGGSKVYTSTRASPDVDFSPSQLVMELSDHSPSPGIDVSYDGLSIYVTDFTGDLYEARRPDRSSRFAAPVLVATKIAWPSVSPDGLELFFTDEATTSTARRIRTVPITSSFDLSVTEVINQSVVDPDITPDAEHLIAVEGDQFWLIPRTCQ